ncbi:hypothetical protein PIB30_079487 [Stylosanthes scabra]|uniref:Putative plant transposon protein domain-containing protein n=1 Tax=Stylosanthes scabra TaxID=79078 RepID=A0ABU6WPF3_9FABA|nr:hypothetical protein [Stylosanthes scabra]
MASSSAPISVFDRHRFRKEFNQELFNSHARKTKVIPKVGFNLNEDKYPQIMEQVDFSPSNIRRVMRFKSTTEGAETDYTTRKAMDQRLDEVLRNLCIPGATWNLSSSQPAVPIQLKRTEHHPLAKGGQEFIIYSLVPTGNKSEVTITRAILIHSIMQGEDVRAEEIIADNIATIAQGLTNDAANLFTIRNNPTSASDQVVIH